MSSEYNDLLASNPSRFPERQVKGPKAKVTRRMRPRKEAMNDMKAIQEDNKKREEEMEEMMEEKKEKAKEIKKEGPSLDDVVRAAKDMLKRDELALAMENEEEEVGVQQDDGVDPGVTPDDLKEGENRFREALASRPFHDIMELLENFHPSLEECVMESRAFRLKKRGLAPQLGEPFKGAFGTDAEVKESGKAAEPIKVLEDKEKSLLPLHVGRPNPIDIMEEEKKKVKVGEKKKANAEKPTNEKEEEKEKASNEDDEESDEISLEARLKAKPKPEPQPRREGCPTCLKTFSSPVTLSEHIRTIHGQANHACPLCDKTFYKPFKLRRHMKSRHPKETGNYRTKRVNCSKCPAFFQTEEALNAHYSLVHGNRDAFNTKIAIMRK